MPLFREGAMEIKSDNVIIRPYQEGDREILRGVLKDVASYTRKGGRDPGKREALCWMYSDYYFDWEPRNVLVSVHSGKVCGFIVGSTDSDLFQAKMREIYIPRIRKVSVVWALFHRICLAVNRRQDLRGGVAFHINIADGHQGHGIGKRLMTAMMDLMADRGMSYLYLVTENRGTPGYGFYSKLGFRETRHYPGGSLMMVKDLR